MTKQAKTEYHQARGHGSPADVRGQRTEQVARRSELARASGRRTRRIGGDQ